MPLLPCGLGSGLLLLALSSQMQEAYKPAEAGGETASWCFCQGQVGVLARTWLLMAESSTCSEGLSTRHD